MKRHYMMFSNGTGVDEGYAHDLLIHLLIKDSKIVILKNDTEFDIDIDLLIAGIKEKEIIIPHPTEKASFIDV